MNRTSVGLIALLLLVIGGIAAWRGPADGSALGFGYGCIRVGLVLGALWLALPQIKAAVARIPSSLWTWLVSRKTKPGSGGEEAPRPPRPKRPRRRSNS